MPSLYRIGQFVFKIWTDESPREAIHIHVARKGEKKGNKKATAKFWLTTRRTVKFEYNRAGFNSRELNEAARFIVDNFDEIVRQYTKYHSINAGLYRN